MHATASNAVPIRVNGLLMPILLETQLSDGHQMSEKDELALICGG